MSESISNNKRIAKNTLFLYGRMLLSMLISLYTARVVLNTLGASDFGLFNVVGGVIAVFGVLKSLISTGTQRFLTYEMGKGSGIERLTAVFTTSLSTFLMIGGAIFVLGETIGLWFVNKYLVIPEGRLFAANVVYQVSILSMFVSVIQLPYSAAIMSHERMDIYGYMGIGEPLLRLLLILLLPIIPYDKLIVYAIITIIISSTVTSLYVVICRRLFEECRFRLKIDKPLFKSMIGFTMWNMLESISNMLAGQGQNILLNMFFGTTVNASRAVANQVNHTVHGFASNFLVAMYPQITKTYASGKIKECNDLMLRGAKFSYIILAVLMIPIFLNTDYLLTLWLKTPPTDSALFCQLIMLTTIIRIVSEPLYTGIQASGNIRKYQIWTSSLTLFNLPICYVIFKIGKSANWAFYVGLIMAVILVIARVYFVNKETGLPIKRFLKILCFNCIAVSLLAIVPLYFLNNIKEMQFGWFCIMSVLSVIWSVFLFAFLSMSKIERAFIISMVKRNKK